MISQRPDTISDLVSPQLYAMLDNLENSIRAALEQFSADTGLDVQAVEVSPVMDEGPTVYGVHCIVTL